MKNTLLLLALIASLCSFAAPDWVLVQNNEGSFRMSFPSAPLTDIDTARPEGKKIPWKSFMYNSMQSGDDNPLYGLSYADYPASEISSDVTGKKLDDFLDHILANSVTGINGHVVKQETITYRTYPGREIKVSFAHGKAVMDLKIYLIHSRCYILQVGYMLTKEGNPSIGKFFSSFDFLGDK